MKGMKRIALLGGTMLYTVNMSRLEGFKPVSYTHLDVYKRQVIDSYDDTVQSMDTEKLDAAKEAARSYNEQLSNAVGRDAARCV